MTASIRTTYIKDIHTSKSNSIGNVSSARNACIKGAIVGNAYIRNIYARSVDIIKYLIINS